jgi:succinate dehydrogenase / fumarate reductase cytochrome b subunit
MSSVASKSLRLYFSTSVGKKQLMAITGLLLSGFLVTHLLGNILIVVGADAFNYYAYKLTSNPLIYVAEAGLAGLFLLHLVLAMVLTVQNKKSRGSNGYFMKVNTGRGTTFASKSMPYTGFVILIFLILHIRDLKFGPVYMTTVDGVEMRDLHRTVIEYFADPLHTAWYVFAMAMMALHLGHGFSIDVSVSWLAPSEIYSSD